MTNFPAVIEGERHGIDAEVSAKYAVSHSDELPVGGLVADARRGTELIKPDASALRKLGSDGAELI